MKTIKHKPRNWLKSPVTASIMLALLCAVSITTTTASTGQGTDALSGTNIGGHVPAETAMGQETHGVTSGAFFRLGATTEAQRKGVIE